MASEWVKPFSPYFFSVFTDSVVAYGNDRYLLAQSTKFGTHILWAKAKLFGGGYPILKVKVKVKGQTSLIAIYNF